MANAFKLNNNQVFVTTEAPGGVYSSEQLKKIAEVSNETSAVIKATEDHRLGFFIAEDKLDLLTSQLAEVGIEIRHYQAGLHQPVACVGGQCPKQEQDALATAMDVTEAIEDIKMESPLRIGINGCFSCCVPTHTLDISVVGETNGYKLSIGGKNSLLPEFASFVAEGIPADKLPALIAEVTKVYNSLAEEDESLHDVLERVGAEKFIEATAPYSQDAANDDPFAELSAEPEQVDVAEVPVEAVAAEAEAPQAEVADQSNDLEIDVDQGVNSDETDEEFVMEAQVDSDSNVDIDPGDLKEDSLVDDVLIGDDEIGGEEVVATEALENEATKTTAEVSSDDVAMSDIDDSDEEVIVATEEDESQDSGNTPEAEELEMLDLEEGSTSEELENSMVASDEDLSLSDREELISDLDVNDEIDNDQLDQLENSMIEQAEIADLSEDENSSDRDQAIGMVEEGNDSFIKDIESFSPEMESNDQLFGGVEEMSITDNICSFNFASGEKLSFDLSKIAGQGGKRELVINNQVISVEISDESVTLVIDGVEISVPSDSYAAA